MDSVRGYKENVRCAMWIIKDGPKRHSRSCFEDGQREGHQFTGEQRGSIEEHKDGGQTEEEHTGGWPKGLPKLTREYTMDMYH